MIIVATILHGKTSVTQTVLEREWSKVVPADLTAASVATFFFFFKCNAGKIRNEPIRTL